MSSSGFSDTTSTLRLGLVRLGWLWYKPHARVIWHHSTCALVAQGLDEEKMSSSRKRLPDTVAEHVRAHHDALAAITAGEDRTAEAEQAADQALRAAMASAPSQPSTWTSPAEEDFETIIATRLAETRNECGWTQEQLAEAMSPYAKWTRFTVAEIETGRRSVGLEELVILAGLYAEPVVSFMIPTDNTPLSLDHASVPPAALRELLVGKGGNVGTGGRNWTVAARVANRAGARPAPDLWKNRSDTQRHTRPPQSEARTRAKKKDK
jgi:DNA-binding XRE family transcriptional regulator